MLLHFIEKKEKLQAFFLVENNLFFEKLVEDVSHHNQKNKCLSITRKINTYIKIKRAVLFNDFIEIITIESALYLIIFF